MLGLYPTLSSSVIGSHVGRRGYSETLQLSAAKTVGIESGEGGGVGVGIQNGAGYGPGQYSFMEKRISAVNKVK